MLKFFLAGPLRALLAAAGGWLVSKGWIDPTDVQPLTGALMVIATIAWSVRDKLHAKKVADGAYDVGFVHGAAHASTPAERMPEPSAVPEAGGPPGPGVNAADG